MPRNSERARRNHFYYWKDYADDVRGGVADTRLQLNQNSPRMTSVRPGDIVWAFTRRGRGHYILAARIAVEAAGRNRSGTSAYRRGEFYFRSTANGTIYFQPDFQPNAEMLIRGLGPTAKARFLGMSFQGDQGVAEIQPTAVDSLETHAAGLPLDEKITAPAAADAWFTRHDTAGGSPLVLPKEPPERVERITEMLRRDRRQVTELKKLYGGYCQLTGKLVWDGVVGDVTEVHHIHWLSRGGPDTTDNMVVLSPDAHSVIHAADAEFDRATLRFRIAGRWVPLAVNHHLKSGP